jgi:hypothetical protein
VNGSDDMLRWPGWLGVALRIEGDCVAAWGVALKVIERVTSAG